MGSREIAINNLKNGGGKPVGAATRLTRAKANELNAKGNDGLSVMVDNMVFWRDKAKEIGAVMEEQLVRIKELQNASEVADAIKEFNKTSVFFLAARDHAHRCAVDVAPYTNPRLQAITINKTSTHTEILMELKAPAQEENRAYRADGNVITINRSGS